MTTDSVWEVPQPISIRVLEMDDGALVTVRRHGNPDGPRLVLSHGTGLAIDQYYPFWSLLADVFDVVVYDLRNHGWNPVGDVRGHDFPGLINDQQLVHSGIQRHFGAKPTFGVFHSLSALTSLLSPTRGAEFARRILFDPPVSTLGATHAEFLRAIRSAIEMTGRRAYRFRTREDYVTLLRGMPRFDLLAPAALRLMAQTTLRESPDDEGYELCCPREHETRLARGFEAYSLVSNLGAMGCPTLIVGADADSPYSYMPPFKPDGIPGVDYEFLPGTTHFLPLEKPEDCAAIVIEYIGIDAL